LLANKIIPLLVICRLLLVICCPLLANFLSVASISVFHQGKISIISEGIFSLVKDKKLTGKGQKTHWQRTENLLVKDRKLAGERQNHYGKSKKTTNNSCFTFVLPLTHMCL